MLSAKSDYARKSAARGLLEIAANGRVRMQLNMTDDEAHTLRRLLHDYLPELKREVSRTDAREFRHELAHRQDVCERVLQMLEGNGA
jgi:hypothetical protein